MSKICECDQPTAAEEPIQDVTGYGDTTECKLDDETEEVFAAPTQLTMNEAESDVGTSIMENHSEEREQVIFPQDPVLENKACVGG